MENETAVWTRDQTSRQLPHSPLRPSVFLTCWSQKSRHLCGLSMHVIVSPSLCLTTFFWAEVSDMGHEFDYINCIRSQMINVQLRIVSTRCKTANTTTHATGILQYSSTVPNSTRILDQGNHISPTFVLVHGIWSCQGKKELTQLHIVQCIYPNTCNLLEMPWKQDSHAS